MDVGAQMEEVVSVPSFTRRVPGLQNSDSCDRDIHYVGVLFYWN